MAVRIIVEHGHPRAHRFGEELVPLGGVLVDEVDAGLLGDLDEPDLRQVGDLDDLRPFRRGGLRDVLDRRLAAAPDN